MFINNEDLFEKKCKFCLYQEKRECLRPRWIVPAHYSCLSFQYKSNLTKISAPVANRKRISDNSPWSDIAFSAQQASNDEDKRHAIELAVSKKAALIYNFIPTNVGFCDSCNLYYIKDKVCPVCEEYLEFVYLSIIDIQNIILEVLEEDGGLGAFKSEDIVKKIQYWDVSDLRIVE